MTFFVEIIYINSANTKGGVAKGLLFEIQNFCGKINPLHKSLGICGQNLLYVQKIKKIIRSELGNIFKMAVLEPLRDPPLVFPLFIYIISTKKVIFAEKYFGDVQSSNS